MNVYLMFDGLFIRVLMLEDDISCGFMDLLVLHNSYDFGFNNLDD